MNNLKTNFLATLLSFTAVMTGSVLLNQSAMAGGLNGPHTHDELEFTVLKTENQVVFNLIAPAFNIAGYEHAPKSKDNKKAALGAEKSLYEVENLKILFQFSPDNVCQPFEAYVNSDLLNIHSHSKEKDQSFISMLSEKEHPKKAEDDVHVAGVGGHTDFVMSYVFDCGKVETVTLGFIKQFPSLKKMNLRAKNLEGDVIKTFTSTDKPVITFKKD
jgi:hypothetical protein